MINKEEILAMLRDGKDADDIAKQLVDALNDAQADYEDEKAKEAEAKAKAEQEAQIEADKIDDMQVILDLIHDFILEYYCEDEKDIDQLGKIFEQFTPEEVIKQVEEAGAMALELTKSFGDIEKLLNSPSKFVIKTPLDFDFKPAVKVKTPAQIKKDADATINAFLKSIGL